jgi:hypothetical protein
MMIARRQSQIGASALLVALAIPGIALAQHDHKVAAKAPQSCDTSAMQSAMMGGHMGEGMMSMMGGGNMTMGMGGVTMRHAMDLQPGRILTMADDLELTSGQRSQLKELEESRRTAHAGWMKSWKEGNESLAEWFGSADVDVGALRNAAQRAFTPHFEMHVRMLSDAVAARDILTEVQLEKVRDHKGQC